MARLPHFRIVFDDFIVEVFFHFFSFVAEKNFCYSFFCFVCVSRMSVSLVPSNCLCACRCCFFFFAPEGLELTYARCNSIPNCLSVDSRRLWTTTLRGNGRVVACVGCGLSTMGSVTSAKDRWTKRNCQMMAEISANQFDSNWCSFRTRGPETTASALSCTMTYCDMNLRNRPLVKKK